MTVVRIAQFVLVTVLASCTFGSVGEHNSILGDSADDPTPRAQTNTNNRIVLSPARWKILRDRTFARWVQYTFDLDEGWDFIVAHLVFPSCTAYACVGKSDYRHTCEDLCEDQRLMYDRLRSVSGDYVRAVGSLRASLSDLKTVTLRITAESALTANHLLFEDSRRVERVDVLRSYTDAIGKIAQTLNMTLKENIRGLGGGTLLGIASVNELRERVNLWLNNAQFVAERVASALHEAHKAQMRVQLCTQSALRLDMSDCDTRSTPIYYTDTPTHASSTDFGLHVQTARETWDPVVLRRWYMAFTTLDRGSTQVCWLTRDMITDGTHDYITPQCDRRGLCHSLLADNSTYASCNVRDNDELPVDCPVVCGSPCLGPLCYELDSKRYVLRNAIQQASLSNDIASPRPVRAPYGIYNLDIAEFKLRVESMLKNTSIARERGESVLHDAAGLRLLVDEYTKSTSADQEVQRSDLRKARENCAQVHTMAIASIILSAIVAPLLLMIVLLCTRS